MSSSILANLPKSIAANHCSTSPDVSPKTRSRSSNSRASCSSRVDASRRAENSVKPGRSGRRPTCARHISAGWRRLRPAGRRPARHPPLDSQQTIGRAHVAKEESAGGADLENAGDFRRRADVAQAGAAAAALLNLDIIDGQAVGTRHGRALSRDHPVQHEYRHVVRLGAKNGRLRLYYGKTLNCLWLDLVSVVDRGCSEFLIPHQSTASRKMLWKKRHLCDLSHPNRSTGPRKSGLVKNR